LISTGRGKTKQQNLFWVADLARRVSRFLSLPGVGEENLIFVLDLFSIATIGPVILVGGGAGNITIFSPSSPSFRFVSSIGSDSGLNSPLLTGAGIGTLALFLRFEVFGEICDLSVPFGRFEVR